jgi:hypothetical protein
MGKSIRKDPKGGTKKSSKQNGDNDDQSTSLQASTLRLTRRGPSIESLEPVSIMEIWTKKWAYYKYRVQHADHTHETDSEINEPKFGYRY